MAVSLARRTDRRTWMEGTCLAPLRAMGFEAHLVDAIDGAAGGLMGGLPLPCIDGMPARRFEGWALGEVDCCPLATAPLAAGPLAATPLAAASPLAAGMVRQAGSLLEISGGAARVGSDVERGGAGGGAAGGAGALPRAGGMHAVHVHCTHTPPVHTVLVRLGEPR